MAVWLPSIRSKMIMIGVIEKVYSIPIIERKRNGMNSLNKKFCVAGLSNFLKKIA